MSVLQSAASLVVGAALYWLIQGNFLFRAIQQQQANLPSNFQHSDASVIWPALRAYGDVVAKKRVNQPIENGLEHLTATDKLPC